MPPKKSTAAASKKASGSSTHGPFKDMVREAIIALKERNGSSRQAIKKYILANNNLDGLSGPMFNSRLNRTIAAGVAGGDFDRPKGPSGPVKLAKPAPKKKAKAAPAKEAATAVPKEKKTTTAKKPAPGKGAVKKTTAKKAAAAKPATKAAPQPKANASKPRKAAAAPAVSEEPVRVVGKTKSGRVTKSRAPAPVPAKGGAKKTGPKKSPAKKGAAKKDTPQKAST